MQKANSVFGLMPLEMLNMLRKRQGKSWRYAEVVDEVRLRKYMNRYFINGGRIELSNDCPCCKINTLEWDYPLFNICFFENVLKNIIYCLANGYKPVVSFVNTKDNVNLWEEFFCQPFDVSSADEVEINCDVKTAPIYFPTFPTSEDVKLIGKLYGAFWKPNKETALYFEREYNSLIAGKRVLGVLSRGTDYIATKPKGHPIQPNIEELIQKTEEQMKSLNCDSIYLATEEYTVVQKFEEVFPRRIITNKRRYFDEYYSIHDDCSSALISAVDTGRENDGYWKSMEYLSSINLLSRCCGLVAGCCGGSRAAMYLNNGKYEYAYLFDLGTY